MSAHRHRAAHGVGGNEVQRCRTLSACARVQIVTALGQFDTPFGRIVKPA